MPTKLMAHVQDQTRPGVESFLIRTQMPGIKFMGNCTPEFARRVIASYERKPLIWWREYMDTNEQAYLVNAQDGAAEFWNRKKDSLLRWRAVTDIVEVANEYQPAPFVPLDPSHTQKLSEFTTSVVQILHGEGFRVVGGNFYPGFDIELLKFFSTALETIDFLGIHEYYWPGIQNNIYSGRASDIVSFLARQGLRQPPILITECGWDRILAGHKENRGGANQEWAGLYHAWLISYDEEIGRIPAVVGAAVFQTGAASDWVAKDFDIVGSPLEAAFTNYIQRKRAEMDKIRVLLKDTNEVLELELEEYLRGVVPAEAYASWHFEALKAQAVAARSYALWRKANPRSSTFDIYGDARDQAYNPSRIHWRTDLAIQETKCQYLRLENGKAFCAQYISWCGLEKCPACQEKAKAAGQPVYLAGYDNKSWPGRMCQWGAQKLATQGKVYGEILRFYYGDISYGAEPETEPPPETPEDNPLPEHDDLTLAFDADGNQVDLETLLQKYGVAINRRIAAAGEPYYRVTEVRENTGGSSATRVTIKNSLGAEQVAWSWPGAPLEEANSLDPGANFIVATLSPEDFVDFPMGTGAYHSYETPGPHEVWVRGNFSDHVTGLGMIAGTNHHHLDVVYTRGVHSVAPEEPEETQAEHTIHLPYVIKTGLDKVRESIETALGELSDICALLDEMKR